jgi:hypothetical protein
MSISGVVVDTKGEPVPNKAVHLKGITGGQEQPRKHTITNTDGRFSFNRISIGSLQLQAGWASDDDEGFLDAQAGDKNVKIVLGQERIHTAGFSLVGKPLPELEQYGLKTASDAEGKKMLVCFWDMLPGPSNCVQQLGKMEKFLAAEGVYAFIVYVGMIDDSRLSDCLNNNRITIPCGKFDGNIAMLGRTWAVQTLPWLILTDRKHIVTAEDFSPAELSEKIKGSDDF